MSDTEYGAALKLGKKQYQDSVAKGEYPYLPVLDEALSYTDIVSQVSLGTMDIPLSKLVGTKTAERSISFANNFMPLLTERSEFAIKWQNLYNYQVEDGINDPIVAYEFMNRFYVQEGNKRVSVMKYLGAYSIPGTVIRLIPKRTDDLENRLYYEFLDFYKVSSNCDVWFSKEGRYNELLKLMGLKPDQIWTEEERIYFRSAYGRFAKAFQMAHGDRLKLTEGDAFLVYIEVYGYDNVKGQTEREMYRALMRIWEEIQLANRGNKIELIQDPQEVEEDKKPAILKWFLPQEEIPSGLKVGFIYGRTAETSRWIYGHELGRMYLEQVFPGKLTTMVVDHVETEDDVAAAIEKEVKAGCTIIFTITSRMLNQSVRSAAFYPDIKFYNCSINMSYSSVCNYYARMYEAKFLMGAIAAALSREDKLGYIAEQPTYGMLADINAFALGARMVNPYVEVHLEWARRKKKKHTENILYDKGIRYISGHDMINPDHPSREYGLYLKKEDGTIKNLAMPVWHWGKFYEQIIRLAFKSTEEIESMKGKKAVNYWWGMSADVIDVICSENIPNGTRRLIEFLKNSIRAGSFHPFDGLIYAQDGSAKCTQGKSLKAEEIITMNWLAQNVVGYIPEIEEMNERAQELMQLQGIKTAGQAETENDK